MSPDPVGPDRRSEAEPEPDRSLKGRLVVAAPALSDPNFARSVVLILEHGDEGALGVALNRPSDTAVEEALPEWRVLSAAPEVVFVGGPVEPAAVICVARATPGAEVDNMAAVGGRLGVIDLHLGAVAYLGELDALRLFAGYAGWGAGQLEDEIAEGAWYVVDVVPDDVLTDEPGELWHRVLRRQGGRLARLANFPPDPSLN